MLPAVALVGRPNVGKSTLFNRLTRSRDALVADYPGLTRDRRYGFGKAAGRSFVIIDTGGVGGDDTGGMGTLVARQVEIALEEADAIVLVVDHKDGLTEADAELAEKLRRTAKPVVVAVNKAEGIAGEMAEAEFHGLGLGPPAGVSALHGQGVAALVERVLSPFKAAAAEEASGAAAEEAPGAAAEGPRLVVVGRPNVGKSTLINRLLGEERLVTSPEPGTTRDTVLVPCEREGRRFVLLDTAGIRRRARVSEAVEKYSVVQSLQAIEDAGVAIVLIDAREGVTDQDLHLIGLVTGRGRALTIGVNKWDNLPGDERHRIEAEVQRRLEFVSFADVHYLSALHGSGIVDLLDDALAAHQAAGRELPTPRLNEVLDAALNAHPAPVIRGRQVRLRYAHQGGRYPPRIVVHGTQAHRVPDHYRRYLENTFRSAFGLRGTPIKLELRSGENPFAGKRNPLTRRQRQRRRRVMRHGK